MWCEIIERKCCGSVCDHQVMWWILFFFLFSFFQRCALHCESAFWVVLQGHSGSFSQLSGSLQKTCGLHILKPLSPLWTQDKIHCRSGTQLC